ncbi:cobalt-zinc-cadmium resistance protein CzcC precursor [mine drainage metagenome]|uniref:Cobalt-zinc-cadmium resistance protein CzcC n=1 Tax=mine drainage metagenome TaxID=410659 RepID=A0A1J5RR95_9ZZZZ
MMVLLKKSIVFMLAALLLGCAGFQSKPIAPWDTATAFEARTLDSFGLRDFVRQNGKDVTTWPLTSWDASLLTLAAFYYHPDLDVARAQWGVAQAGVVSAGSIPNPGLSLSTNPASTISRASALPFGWNLDIPIETAGKRGYRIEQSKQLSESARFHLYGAAWQIRSRLKMALVELYSAQEGLMLLQEQEDVRNEMAKLLNRRLEIGEISLPEATQARIALAQNSLAILDVQKRYDTALAQLATAIGLPINSLREMKFSFDELTELPKPETLPSEETRRQALLSRSDLLSALADYEASQAALQLEVAKQYPDIHLGPGYVWDQGERKWSVGLSFSLPIFNRNAGPIAEANARREQAAASFVALQARSINEVDLAWTNYQSAANQLANADSLLKAQQQQQRSITAEFKVGESDRLTLAGSQLELVNAKLARLDALVKEMLSLGLLEDATQHPLTQKELPPNLVETNPRKEEKH